MLIEFRIVGGHIKMPKKTFTKEMLSKDSILRGLLDWKKDGNFAGGHPLVSEQDGMVIISFSSDASVPIGDSPKEMLGGLKAKYREKIKGSVVCRGAWSAIEIDLNSDSDKIEYSM